MLGYPLTKDPIMKHRISRCALLAATVAICLPAATSSAQEKKPAPPKKSHTVAKGDLHSVVTLDATVESGAAIPMSVKPDQWADMTVVRAVPHGTPVRKGDLVVELDLSKLDDAIDAASEARKTAKLALHVADHELKQAVATNPLTLAAADRTLDDAKDALSYFEKTGRELRENSARRAVKSAERSLESAEEELHQLVKMYEADDLTEETEEIIVKRARYSVERAREFLNSARL